MGTKLGLEIFSIVLHTPILVPHLGISECSRIIQDPRERVAVSFVLDEMQQKVNLDAMVF
jgi:hypothetical protein